MKTNRKCAYQKNISKNILYQHNVTIEQYQLFIVNNLLHNTPCRLVATFKDNMINDYMEEFLKRIYKNKESQERIPKYAKFYKNFLLLFCKPTISDLLLNEIIKKYCEEKAEEYYRKKFPEDNLESENDEEINKSGDEVTIQELENNNNTIFTNTLKESIDNNTMITNAAFSGAYSNDVTLSLRENEKVESVNGNKAVPYIDPSKENTIIALIEGVTNTKNSNINGNSNNKKSKRQNRQSISAYTKRKIQQILLKGFNQQAKNPLNFNSNTPMNTNLLSNHLNLHNLIKLNLKKTGPKLLKQKSQSKSKPKSQNKSKPTHKSNQSVTINANTTKSRNPLMVSHNIKNSLNSIYKTVDFALTNSTSKLNFTKTQNIEALISTFSLSKNKNNNNSCSKKRLVTEINTSHSKHPPNQSSKHIKPIIKIKKSTSNIKLTSYNKKIGGMGPSNNEKVNNKNDLMKIALSFLLDNNHKKVHHHTNTNINININNQININTCNNNNNNAKNINLNFNGLNEKLNKKIKMNDNVMMNIKSNLNHLSRNTNANINSTNTINNHKNANRIMTSYHNKSISSLTSLLVKKKNGFKSSLSKSKSKIKK